MSEKINDKNLKQNVENKEKGVFFINQKFNDELLEFLFLDMKKAIDNKSVEKIKIYINSSGGYLSTLFPLVDLIDSTNKNIETICLGKAYSCGAMLLLAGKKRFAYKNSNILLHEVACDYGHNKNSQNQEYSKWLNEQNKKLIKMVKEKTIMSKKEIDKYFKSNKDIFINSTQALKYKIIDKII